MRVLLVEDDVDLSRQLKTALTDAGYAVDHAPDGEEAWFLGDTEPYDVVVLDLGLPKIDGVSVLERWRREGKATPVLILTARGAWSDKVAGFDAGADDYLTKPFHTEELLARLRALLRRSAGHAAATLSCGGLRLDPRAARATVNGEPLRIAASMKQLPGRDRPVIFFAGIDRSDVDADTRQFATVTWIAMLLLGAGLVTAVFIQVQVGLRPLFDLGDEISDVRQGRSHRVEGAYPVEIQPLAEQVNRLLAHNQETVERQRTHVGNLAHALKTPLAVMLAEAGTKEGPLPDLIRRQTKVMQDQVDHHLRRARAAARAAHGLGERTAVAEVLDEMAVMLERVFETKGVEIDWRAPDDLAFLGERQDLQEIFGNLIENAAKWCTRRVRISAGPSTPGQMIAVVEDDGPGLPADQRDTALKRGTRMDEDTPGTGLGLSIVDELTRAYGGRVTLGDSDMGGLKVVLELPAAEG